MFIRMFYNIKYLTFLHVNFLGPVFVPLPAYFIAESCKKCQITKEPCGSKNLNVSDVVLVTCMNSLIVVS